MSYISPLYTANIISGSRSSCQWEKTARLCSECFGSECIAREDRAGGGCLFLLPMICLVDWELPAGGYNTASLFWTFTCSGNLETPSWRLMSYHGTVGAETVRGRCYLGKWYAMIYCCFTDLPLIIKEAKPRIEGFDTYSTAPRPLLSV